MTPKDALLVTAMIVLTVGLGLYFYNNYIIVPIQPHNESGGVCDINDPCFVNLSNDINIAAFNLQIFGLSKASNDSLLNRYADIFNDYTITFASEVRDESGDAVRKLCANPLLENYTCFTSSRAGLSSSKEQYLLIYKKANNIKLLNTIDYNSIIPEATQRPPLMALFNINGKDYRFYTMHTSPSTVPEDLELLDNITNPYAQANATSTIILGDFNMDCKYFNVNNHTSVLEDWALWIPNSADTTTGASNCAYDRVFVNDNANNAVVASGVRTEGVDSSLSDHYPVYVTLKAS